MPSLRIDTGTHVDAPPNDAPCPEATSENKPTSISKSILTPTEPKKKAPIFFITIGDRSYLQNPQKGIRFQWLSPGRATPKTCRLADLHKRMMSTPGDKGAWVILYESKSMNPRIYLSPVEARQYLVNVVRHELKKGLEVVVEEDE